MNVFVQNFLKVFLVLFCFFTFTQIHAEVTIRIGTRVQFLNTVSDIRKLRETAITNNWEHINLRYQTGNTGGRNPRRIYTYLRMRVNDFYIVNYATGVEENQNPNYNHNFPTTYRNRDRITPTREGLENALINPSNNNAAELIGHLFAETVRSNVVRNVLADNLYRSGQRTLADVGELVNSWARVSGANNINIHTNDFRPLNQEDYVLVANAQTEDNIRHRERDCLSALTRALIHLSLTQNLLRDCRGGRGGREAFEILPTNKPAAEVRISTYNRTIEITSEHNAQVCVYTTLGAMVGEKTKVQKGISTQLKGDFAKGLYIVHVTEDTGKTTTKKVFLND